MIDLGDISALRSAIERGSFDERVKMLTQVVSERGRDLTEIHLLCSLSSVDMTAFLEAMRMCLSLNNRNLLAIQALIWGLRRSGQVDEARACILGLLALNPSDMALTLDLLRSEIVQPSPDADRHLDWCMASIKDPLVMASYAYQLGTRFSNRACPSQRDDLGAELKKARDRFLVRDIAETSEHQDGTAGPWDDACRRIASARSIAIVGNGSSVLDRGFGPLIDTSDIVIRINFPVLQGYAADIGQRTNLVVFSEGLLNRMSPHLDRDAIYRSVPLLAISPFPTARSLCADPVLKGLLLGRVPSHVRESLTGFSYDLATTGCLLVCLCVMLSKATLSIYGFDFYRDTTRPHYFAGHDQVFLGHDVAYERFLIEDVVAGLY